MQRPTNQHQVNKNKSLGEVLKEATKRLSEKGLEFPHLEASLLLAHILKKSKEYLITHPERPLSKSEVEKFNSLIKRRLKGEPVAYILGYKEFWDKKFLCSKDALIPRPETELIIEEAIKRFNKNTPHRILDLGTGTGAIGITLSSLWPEAKIFMTDISFKALRLCQKNCRNLLKDSLKNCFLVCCDWFSAIKSNVKFDIIAVNPPYCSKSQTDILSKETLNFEPHTALFSRDEEGFLEIETLFLSAHNFLTKSGWIFCEIGINQSKRVLEIIKRTRKYRDIGVRRDLNGVERMIFARRQSAQF